MKAMWFSARCRTGVHKEIPVRLLQKNSQRYVIVKLLPNPQTVTPTSPSNGGKMSKIKYLSLLAYCGATLGRCQQKQCALCSFTVSHSAWASLLHCTIHVNLKY